VIEKILPFETYRNYNAEKIIRVFLMYNFTLKAFSEQLLFLDNGKWPKNVRGTIEFLSNFCNIVDSIESLIKNIL